VTLNFGPLIPKTTHETFAGMIKAAEEIAKHGRAYLESGDFDDARRMMNAKLMLQSLRAKKYLPRMASQIVGGYHPLDEAGRVEALKRLKESNGET
jgi:neutral trehalase